jgi:hypothetical protein
MENAFEQIRKGVSGGTNQVSLLHPRISASLKNRLTLRPSKAIPLDVNYSLNLRLSLNALLLSRAVVGVW